VTSGSTSTGSATTSVRGPTPPASSAPAPLRVLVPASTTSTSRMTPGPATTACRTPPGWCWTSSAPCGRTRRRGHRRHRRRDRRWWTPADVPIIDVVLSMPTAPLSAGLAGVGRFDVAGARSPRSPAPHRDWPTGRIRGWAPRGKSPQRAGPLEVTAGRRARRREQSQRDTGKSGVNPGADHGDPQAGADEQVRDPVPDTGAA
jgi:hypothetical protein